MKRILQIIALCAALTNVAWSQNSLGKSDDASRIALAAVIENSNMPMAAQTELNNRILKICTLNGLASDNPNPMFSIRASVDVAGKELTPSAPPMHSLEITVNLFVVDNATGNIFSQTSIDLKGAGQNETKAFIAAIGKLDPKKGQFKTFVEQGKNKILEFYNSQCDLVISRAQALRNEGKNDEANNLLLSVPPVCKECYDQCMQMAGVKVTPNENAPADSVEVETELK